METEADQVWQTNSSAVDPELKAYITNLVSALGGPDFGDPNRPYKLGDDALGCLRDLKKWIKGYDERLDRWDVARAISETSLVTFDLIEILTKWELKHQMASTEEQKPGRHLDRIALACLELLVPLTWPLELNKTTSTNNHYKHAPYLNAARVRYKKAIMNHPQKVVMRAILRVAIPVLRTDMRERTIRDEGILKLVVFFFRNILAIDPPESQLYDVNNDVSRVNTIIGMKDQDVLDFLNMIASGLGQSFVVQDTAILECFFYLLRGIETSELYSDVAGGDYRKKPENSTLKDLLDQEKTMKEKISKSSSSRHSRFGTMVSVDFQGEGRYTVSGQTALRDTSSSLGRIDANKKWRKPKVQRQGKGGAWNVEVPLTDQAKETLTLFIENFLDAGFNSLFTAIRKLIEQEVERLLDVHRMHYLFLMGWFLEAELLRRKRQRANNGIIDDFGLIGAALHQNNFVIVMKLMKESYEKGEKQNFDVLYAGIICFTQILHVIRDMESQSSISDDDKDIAENMKLRLFYEENSLDLMAYLPRSAAKQSEAFLKATIELTHMLLKMLDAFSKQHTVLFIRSKRQRRVRRKQKKKNDTSSHVNDEYQSNNDVENGRNGEDDEDNDEGQSENEAERVTQERKFEFSKFETKFINEDTMEAYKRFFKNYNELSPQEIKWALTFFHRIFVKREVHSLLFSLDFMKLLELVTSSRDGLPASHKSRPEVENFLKYYMTKLNAALAQTPSLYVELLFPKLNEHVYYLDHGYDEIKPSQRSKYAAVFEFVKSDLTEEQQFSIVIAALLDEDKLSLIEWLTERLTTIMEDFRTTYAERSGNMVGYYIDLLLIGQEAVEQKTAVEKDGKFRLLLDMLGFIIPHLNNNRCYLPGNVPISKIEEGIRYLKIYMVEPVDLEGHLASEYLRKKRERQSREATIEANNNSDTGSDDENDIIDTSRNNINIDDDDDNGIDAFNDSRFAALPSEEREARKEASSKKRSKGKQKKQKRQKTEDQDLPAQVRRRIAQEEAIKSSRYITNSDDESDEERDKEFFEREESLRAKLSAQLGGANSIRIPDKEDAQRLFGEIHNRWDNNEDTENVAPSDDEENNNNTNEHGQSEDENEGGGDNENNSEEFNFASDKENNESTVTKRRPRRIALSDDEDDE